jgi:hypothetical protein
VRCELRLILQQGSRHARVHAADEELDPGMYTLLPCPDYVYCCVAGGCHCAVLLLSRVCDWGWG